MSHELRTPMNAIIGFTRLVMRRGKEALPEKQYANLEKILISANHLLGLINDVLDLSKVEAGRMEVKPVEFALEPLVDQCLRTVEPMLRSGRVELVKQIEPGLPTLFSDQDKLRQILFNLLSNAAKFTEAGTITIGARRQRRRRWRSRSPTPASASRADQLELVFEEFRQVDSSSTRQYGGTGLGPVDQPAARAAAGRRHHAGEHAWRGLDFHAHGAAAPCGGPARRAGGAAGRCRDRSGRAGAREARRAAPAGAGDRRRPRRHPAAQGEPCGCRLPRDRRRERRRGPAGSPAS